MKQTVHVIGASGRSGMALCRALAQHNISIQPIIRHTSRWHESPPKCLPVLYAELGNGHGNDNQTLADALKDAHYIVSTAHARHIPEIIAHAPIDAVFVFLGSTRKFTHWPDAHAQGVLLGEHSFLSSGRKGVLLHPTMIYGAQGENNVQRLVRLIRLMPIIPLPRGGKALVQPIYQDDVTRSIMAALQVKWTQPETLVIAGPTPLTYRKFIRHISQAAGLRSRPILPVPASLLMFAAKLSHILPYSSRFLPRIESDEIRRLMEDKNFDIAPMQHKLGVTPRSFKEGLDHLFVEEQSE